MALPKLQTPTYELVLPSTNEKIKFRPFLVKEQKILLMAQESGQDEDIANAVSSLVESCTFGKLDASKSPLFDIEYVFLQVRAKSVGESVELRVTSPDDGETTVPVTVNLDEVQVQFDEGHEKTININESVSMVMKYPSMDMFVKNNFDLADANKVDTLFDLTIDCIESIVEGEDVYPASDSSKKELNEFLEQLNSQQFQAVQAFFETMPKLKHDIKFTNPKTKKKQTVTLEGLASFFG